MRKHQRPRGRVVAAALACFSAGVIIGWLLHSGAPLPAIISRDIMFRATPSIAPPLAAADAQPPNGAVLSAGGTDVIQDLRSRHPQLPIDGANFDVLKGNFDESRGAHVHEAVDILAARNTPVHAVEDGTIAKLFFSKAGGNTIYQYDPSERFCYYYAHLERYADGLRDGATVARGDVIGFVGTSGNAPPDTPHLHFAIFELTPDRHWWQGTAIDPYTVFHE